MFFIDPKFKTQWRRCIGIIKWQKSLWDSSDVNAMQCEKCHRHRQSHYHYRWRYSIVSQRWQMERVIQQHCNSISNANTLRHGEFMVKSKQLQLYHRIVLLHLINGISHLNYGFCTAKIPHFKWNLLRNDVDEAWAEHKMLSTKLVRI